ncbi:MAG: hypothetical protein PVG78_14645 [Desulfobacterales bacterium]
MKQYVIDEIRPHEHHALKAYLDEHFGDPTMDGVYWIPVEKALLSPRQQAHDECQPFFFALELLPQSLAVELLIRTRQRIRCDCIAYATEAQRNWIIDTVDAVFEKLELHT